MVYPELSQVHPIVEESTTPTLPDVVTPSDSTYSFQKPSWSAVWKHFRQEKQSMQCLLCKKVLAYNGGTTSNLIGHLQKMHSSSIKVDKGESL